MDIRLSNHALERIKERAHIAECDALEFVKTAWRRGAKVDDYAYGSRMSYDSAYYRHDEGAIYRVYKGFRFVFSEDGTLITLYADSRKPNSSKRGSHRRYSY